MSKDKKFTRAVVICSLIGLVFWGCLFKALL